MKELTAFLFFLEKLPGGAIEVGGRKTLFLSIIDDKLPSKIEYKEYLSESNSHYCMNTALIVINTDKKTKQPN
ncbi:MAG: hypothetical protein EOO68_31360 [Moraxellaceae bacterium]|nr:MAG: hypothetical protein EOO68_31360 [Moraxellaceae bacterium]